ncbi:hypothetical protein ACFMQL_06655 [Nonomuraea fastidiosa]|uniref:hypothetical protein n=1 Tax=Nonomuraea fastidiosa TaxID=46173 RepID=UPI00366AE21C
MPPATTRTNVDTLAVITPAPTASSSALAAPPTRPASSWVSSVTAAITPMKPSAALSLRWGGTSWAGTSSISQSRPTATAIEPMISARYGLRPYMNAASGTANTKVATLIGWTATRGAKLSATACRQAPVKEMTPPTHQRGRRTRPSEAPSATTSYCCSAAPSA